MQYYVVTFTHTKLAGWAAHLHAHVSYLNKLCCLKRRSARPVLMSMLRPKDFLFFLSPARTMLKKS